MGDYRVHDEVQYGPADWQRGVIKAIDGDDVTIRRDTGRVLHAKLADIEKLLDRPHPHVGGFHRAE